MFGENKNFKQHSNSNLFYHPINDIKSQESLSNNNYSSLKFNNVDYDRDNYESNNNANNANKNSSGWGNNDIKDNRQGENYDWFHNNFVTDEKENKSMNEHSWKNNYLEDSNKYTKRDTFEATPGNDPFFKEISQYSQRTLTAFVMREIDSLFKNITKYIDPRKALNDNRYKLLKSMISQEKKLLKIMEVVDKNETKLKVADSIMNFTDSILSRAYDDFNLSKKYDKNPYDNLKLYLRNNADVMGKQEFWTVAFEMQTDILLTVLQQNAMFLKQNYKYEKYLETSIKDSMKEFAKAEDLNINTRDILNFQKTFGIYEKTLYKKLNQLEERNSKHEDIGNSEKESIVEQLRMINDLRTFNHFRNLNESIQLRIEGTCDIIMELLNKHPERNTPHIKSQAYKTNTLKQSSFNLIKNATYNLLYDNVVKNPKKRMTTTITIMSRNKSPEQRIEHSI